MPHADGPQADGPQADGPTDVLAVDGVVVRYGSLTALAGVDLRVKEGERVAILGPSGCGKTTLLRTIAGLERPAEGRVSWSGRDLAATPPHERRFGLMFQDFALFPHRNVSDNVAFGLRMQRLPRPEVAARADEALELVGLRGYGSRATGTLSGGEAQRVALARALAPRPRLLMLDEPLGSLDRVLRDRLMVELAELLARVRITVLYVTHDQDEAFSVADRAVVMRAGTVEADAPAAELWRRPPTEFVARFLGLVNIADATLTEGRAITPWGTFPVPADAPHAGTARVLVRPDAPHAGTARVLLRPDAFVPAEDGEIRGSVETRMFRGDNVRLRIAVPGAPALDVVARWDRVPAQGETVRLAVNPSGVLLLPGTSTSDALRSGHGHADHPRTGADAERRRARSRLRASR